MDKKPYDNTSGDHGAPLEGLKKIYYHPNAFKVLPYRHNYTQTGEYELTAFFIPYFVQSLREEFMDSRGVCNVVKYKEFLQKERDFLLEVPEEYYKKCAERCWYAEEAFNLEGDNKFNKAKISEQLAEIRLHKRGPRPEAGRLDFIFNSSDRQDKSISGFKWTPHFEGKILILEHPLWSELYELANKTSYKKMDDLYVAGVDGIDIGKNLTSTFTKDASDFCIVIYKRVFGLQEPQIVAIYKDRPNNIREAYKITKCLTLYYNCKINIEATRVGLVTWARENNFLSYFMKRPRATLTDIKHGTSKQYGTPATKTIIGMHTDLTADYVEDYCHNIWFEEILLLLAAYNDENKGKFDIIAALGMALLADLDLSGRQPINVIQEVELFQDYGYFIDENGIKRFGIIPKPLQQIIQINYEEHDPYRIESSDPRLYETNLPSGVYRRY